MNIYTRTDWGARAPKEAPIRLPWSKIDAIVVHYSAAYSDEFPDYKERVRAIQNYHQLHNGWNDIAYNFLFSRDGDEFFGRGWNIMSAATLHHNDHTVAFCFLGADKVGRDDVTDKGRRVLSNLIKTARVRSGKPITVVHQQHSSFGMAASGHKDFVSTDCPGSELYHFITLKGWEVYTQDTRIPYPPKFFKWAAWYLGEGEYKQYGPHNKAVRPQDKEFGLPLKPIYWAALKRFLYYRNV